MIDYCKANSPLPEAITAQEVGATAAFLSSPLGAGITATHRLRRQGLPFHGHGPGPALDHTKLGAGPRLLISWRAYEQGCPEPHVERAS